LNISFNTEYKDLALLFDKMRKKRHRFLYESIDISLIEAENAIKHAEEMLEVVIILIREENPQREFKF
jgi:hypothetical protein